jgi:hypothetical protein
MGARTYWLNFHLAYACRHSGACCTAGWPIPVAHHEVLRIQATSGVRPRQASRTWLLRAADAPAGIEGTLARRSDRACVFHAPDVRNEGLVQNPSGPGCHIHAARPSSCVHFPYLCLIDARGVHVSLSHYCPTAAALLFEHTGDIAIVEGPPPVAGIAVPEGLDARESLPPIADADADHADCAEGLQRRRSDALPARRGDTVLSSRPSTTNGVLPRRGTRRAASYFGAAPFGRRARRLRLMSYDEFSAWERAAVRRTIATERRGGEFSSAELRLFEFARGAVPPPLTWQRAPADIECVWRDLVADRWPAFTPVINRYLAAKLFASWAAYLGDGLPAVRRSADIAHAVLRVEAARHCREAGRGLDAVLLKAAIRQSDLLLVHYADARVLSSATLS